MMLAKPNGSYSSDDLAMLSRVLEQASAASIEGAGAVFSEAAVPALRLRLSKIIMDRFISGETDPERLKAIAVESVRADT